MNSTNEIIYLDHAATSWPKPAAVRQRIDDCFSGVLANSGRSGHAASLRSAEQVFETRQKLAALFGVPDSRNVVFTSGATEAINLVLKGFLDAGDVVFVSPMEHNSVMRPLSGLSRTRPVRVVPLPADRFGRVNWSVARQMGSSERPRLIVLAHASNVNGVVQDMPAARAAFPDAAILADAAQTAGVLPIDVETDGIDFLACSAHKGLLGLTGLGACYLNPAYNVRALREGGTGSHSAEMSHPNHRPDMYEAGTLNLHGIIALGGALDHIESAGPGADLKRQLNGVLTEGLSALSGVRLHSPCDGSAVATAFTVDGLAPDRVALRLERDFGILSRPGLQCAPAAHRHLGTFPAGTVRLSPGFGNTEQQMLHVVAAVRQITTDAGM